MSRTLLIFNPTSGDRSSKDFVDNHVIPTLSEHGIKPEITFATEQAGSHHTASVVLDHLRTGQGDISLVLASGDGTLSDILSGLALSSRPEEDGQDAAQAKFRLHLALIPTGTANALYSSLFPPRSGSSLSDPTYKLQSLKSFVSGGPVRPLTLAVATISAPPGSKRQPQVAGIGSVVVSTAFHASILHDSENLRQEHPTMERFKIAARMNSTRWVNASVKLLPGKSGCVEMYDPASKSFISFGEDDDEDIVDVDGPFAYFVSTVNVDRLEPSFRITPLQSILPPPKASCELIVIRPDRDPSFSWDSPEARETFVPKLWKVLEQAYQDGAHLSLRYAQDGSIVNHGEGPFVVEYFRCGGWEWSPDDSDERAHLLCVDGAISKIEPHGRAFVSTVTPDSKDSGFIVYT